MDPQPPASLQDVFRQLEEQELYVGREEELRLFAENLRIPPGRQGRKYIFNVSGPSGVGKTTLLARFRREAEHQGALAAITDDAETDVPGAMGKLAADLQRAGHPLKDFDEQYEQYRRKRQELESAEGVPTGLRSFLAKSATRLIRRVPGVGIAVDVMGPETVEEGVDEVIGFIAKKLKSESDVLLVREPVEKLTPTFLKDLAKVARDAELALFFDGFEVTGEYLDEWIRAVFKVGGRYGAVPVNLVVVIAGGIPLNRSLWRKYEGAMKRLELQPFTEAEAREYLELKGYVDEPKIARIMELTGRLPMWMAAVPESGSGGEELEDAGDLLDLFFKGLPAAHRQLVMDGALPRLWNRDVLAAMVGEQPARDGFEWLTKAPIVQARGSGWAYLGAARSPLLRNLFKESPKDWSDLHDRLAAYHEALRDEAAPIEEEGIRDQTWRVASLEAIYHRLCQSPKVHLPTALVEFIRAFTGLREFAREWARVMGEAGRDAESEQVSEWADRLSAGMAAIDDKRHDDGIAMWTALLDKGKLDVSSRARALDWRGYLSSLAERPHDAVADYGMAITLAPDEVEYLEDRAIANYDLGDLDHALHDLDRVLEIEPGRSRIFALRGSVHYLLGQGREAVADFSQAIQADPDNRDLLINRGLANLISGENQSALADLDQAMQFGPPDVAGLVSRSQANLLLGRSSEALADLDRALEVQPESATVLFARFEALRRNGQVAEATAALAKFTDDQIRSFLQEVGGFVRKIPFEAVERQLEVFAQDPGTAGRLWSQIKMDPEAGFRAIKASVVASQAVLDWMEGRLDDALTKLDQAIELAPNEPSLLIAKADVFRGVDRPNDAQAALERAIEMDPQGAAAYASRGQLNLVLGDQDKGLADLDRAIELDPRAANSRAMRARVYLVTDRVPEAVADLDVAVEVQPEVVALRFMWAAALLQNGEVDRAAEGLGRINDEQLRGYVHSSKELLTAAPSAMERQLGVDAQALGAWLDAIRGGEEEAVRALQADIASIRAQAKVAHEEFNEALKEVDRAIDLVPDNPGYRLLRAEVNQGLERSHAAMEDLTKAIELDPSLAEAFAERGWLKAASADASGALVDLHRAAELDPSLAIRLALKGLLLQQARQFEGALVDLNHAIDLNPTVATAIGSRGQVHRVLGHLPEALVDLNRAVEMDSSLTWAVIERGEVELLLKQFPDAVRDLSQALAAEDSDWYRYERALAYLALNASDDAESDLQVAIQIADKAREEAPGESGNAFNLALYHLAAGDLEEATNLYRSTAESAPADMLAMAVDDLRTFQDLFPENPLAAEIKVFLEKKIAEGSIA